MSEKEKTYQLHQGNTFLLSGSRDTINMYLRLCLDKWEDIVIADKRKAIAVVKDGEKKGEILKGFEMDKFQAFNAWYTELRGNDWRVEWIEDGVNKYQVADHFFLGVKKDK